MTTQAEIQNSNSIANIIGSLDSLACQKLILNILGDTGLFLHICENSLYLGDKKIFSFTDESPDYNIFDYVFCVGDHRDYSKLELLASKISESIFNEKIIGNAFKSLSEDEKLEVKRYCNLAHEDKVFSRICYTLREKILENILKSTIEDDIYSWLDCNVSFNFVELLKSGLKKNTAISYKTIFCMQQCKDELLEFFKKYPHAVPMLRAIHDAHFSGYRDIFGTIKSVDDLERGDFFVEVYNQPKNYYNYSDAKYKFLADANSWQWLLKQKPKFINTIMKKYAVNDAESNRYAYFGFACTRENLSVISKLNLDEKLSFAILKDYGSSLENDRFDIGILTKKHGIELLEFHNGSMYLAKVKKVLDYFKEKGFSLDEQVKFITTFKDSFSAIDNNIWYKRKHKHITDKSDLELIDEWVDDHIKFLYSLNKLKGNSFLPKHLKLQNGLLKQAC